MKKPSAITVDIEPLIEAAKHKAVLTGIGQAVVRTESTSPPSVTFWVIPDNGINTKTKVLVYCHADGDVDRNYLEE